MTRPHVLISGASIAGPALAFWLRRYGWQATVVEKAPQFRTGGQNIDIRGAAREVLRRAGLEDAVRAATTGEVGTRFLGEGGAVVAEFPAGESDTEGATAEIEILRGDLSRIFVDASTGDASTGDASTGDASPTGDASTADDTSTSDASTTEYVYGDSITAVDDTGDHVRVSFENGPDRTFDLVIAADGIGSSTRRLVFGADGPSAPVIKPLGMDMTYLTLERTPDDDDWWNWYNEPGGLAVTVRPDRHGTTRAVLTSIDYSSDRGASARRENRRSLEEQKQHLRDQFADVGYAAPRILAALDSTEDVYYEAIGQVHAPEWSRGRVALTGDAAWCASPVSGMGTSLSVVGAYVLAGELASHVHHRDAFAAYDRIMRPYVDQAQKLPPGVPKVANPRTALGLRVFRYGIRAASSPVLTKVGGKLFRPPADKIELPDYAHLETTRA
ncbi:FAD-dependent monooxygenase [Frondihabitans cladoniiphilus]|uniref:FAD-dependent monooxygenase n=1 Tax=Frondihabitans cladoniiphilus TaxID=715785 RepID=A0ABP8VK39_9MICO